MIDLGWSVELDRGRDEERIRLRSGSWTGLLPKLDGWTDAYLSDLDTDEDAGAVLLLTFAEDPGPEGREAVLDRFRSGMGRAYAEWDDAPSQVHVDTSLPEHHCRKGYDHRDHRGDGPLELCVWTGPRTFAYARVPWDTDRLPRWLSVRHWQPASMTSGSWGATVVPLGSGAILIVHHEDEEGDRYSVQRVATGPAELADDIHRMFLYSESLFEIHLYGLLTLWALGYPTDGSGEAVRLTDLERAEDPGSDPGEDEYEVSLFWFDPPDEVRDALRAMAQPSEEARASMRALADRLGGS